MGLRTGSGMPFVGEFIGLVCILSGKLRLRLPGTGLGLAPVMLSSGARNCRAR